ncbi:UNVERIFIED_CONTAM: hypothetical protein Slati_0141000 [Sesamum latifolium]|uniref:Uncharacterized protein n=1 Tax=Sesamum latifolium TaxID=2727402 RepID=A0AAW2Y9R5_9LAMI
MDSGMEWGSSSAAAWGWGVIERAKEELEILEMQHPNHFHTLKLDLRAFISEAELHHHSHNNAAISAATQESSSSRKLKRNSDRDGGMMKRRRCKTDAVLERAQQCLHKIQHLKTSLC